jgi:hypothetical protein
MLAGRDELLCSANRERASHSDSAAKCPEVTAKSQLPGGSRSVPVAVALEPSLLHLHRLPGVAVAMRSTSDVRDAYSRAIALQPHGHARAAAPITGAADPRIAIRSKVALQVEG